MAATEKEKNLLAKLAKRFPDIDAARVSVALRRVFLEVRLDSFMDVIKFAREDLGFDHLCTITGLDNGDGFEFIYHVSNNNGIVLNIKYMTGGGDNVIIPSVLPVYHGAAFYERELESLLGVKVSGLPEGRQYPLPDNWPAGQYPMRKDWAPPR